MLPNQQVESIRELLRSPVITHPKTSCPNRIMKKKKLNTKIKQKSKSLRDLAKRGFKGYPIATVACYGPDDKVATKVSVGIVHSETENDPIDMKKWYSEMNDVRKDQEMNLEILA